ncbi:hypothetical protein BGZ76_001255 [Entomortierella beljakovae]|nr:hypothetical protein BGZ76_001255 [Entomortierella beljakovae]
MKNKAQLVWTYLLPKVPLLLGTTAGYYVKGPPKPSWDFQFTIIMAMTRAFSSHFNEYPLKQTQAMSRLKNKYGRVSPGAIATNTLVPNNYRDKAAIYVNKILKDQGIDSDLVGWDWEHDPRAEKPLKGEWTEAKIKDEKFAEGRTILYLHGGGYFLCSIESHRWASSGMAKTGGAKVFAVDYRLAPDSPFPAAIHDALAAYLYLLDPPTDAGFAPVDPKNLVIMGDSAGGGLTFATALAIRDAGLPMPAGIIGWSPWIDLMLSMPSVVENTNTCYLPPGFTQPGDASVQNLAKLAKKITEDKHDKLHLQEIPFVHYYAHNKLLDCKYVSPVLENNLEGMCPIMIIAGDAEVLRDESIVFAKKHVDAPTGIQLRVYDDMPHVFQLFGFLPSSKHAMWESGDFVRKVTSEGPSESNLKKYQRISVQGWRRDLEEDAVPEWTERIGKLGGGPKSLAKL